MNRERMVREGRVKPLNRGTIRKGKWVLYWMQASQRAEENHALEYAAMAANEIGKPLHVFFGITDRYPEANERHYAFMIEGLREVRRTLERRGIDLVIQHRSPDEGAVEWSRDACLVVVDRGYTRIQREWRERAASRIECPLLQVESDVVVPVEVASPKEEYSAATLRRKLSKTIKEYLVPVGKTVLRKETAFRGVDRFDLEDVAGALSRLSIDRSVSRFAAGPRGGSKAANALLGDFLANRLDDYPGTRNDPVADGTSRMSPYLHFGQISPLAIALRVMEAGGPGCEPYLEELIVRRELSMNFVAYNDRYDRLEALPEWCRKTLAKHRRDRREYLYGLREFEEARTHDPYWNAAQQEMVVTGRMHGYMRMYWGKKILEWSETPEEAFRIALVLNNKYELDGRDPNGYAGVAWCFGKHDRPWGERPVFGTVRYMNDRGLRRKFDADAYVKKIERICRTETSR
ncbi:MAG TPA: deoxyribodipyrimidine photo-lyase [Candidatus Deferrimicrobiaceae bacterium]|nr:deoxyribodipyrimidine photo-lyase [Candidatus Deferrimicrobiaceae bacterium]